MFLLRQIDISITPGTHATEKESTFVCFKEGIFAKLGFFFLSWIFLVNRQINDKERIQAALENPYLKPLVEGEFYSSNPQKLPIIETERKMLSVFVTTPV